MHLLASDFDNTLYFHRGFRDKDLKAIQAFQKKGNLFGVCTGRHLGGVLKPSKDVDINYDFYLLISGGMILNKNKEIIFQKMIPFQVMKDLYEQLHIDISIICNEKMYRLANVNYRSDFTLINSLEELQVEQVNAFSFHYPPQELEKAKQTCEMINTRYGDYVHAFQNNEHVDVCAAGCSKGHAVKIIQEYFHLRDEQIAGIGDSWNDVPMIETVKHSYTFDYAPQDLQLMAEYVVSDLSECIDDLMK